MLSIVVPVYNVEKYLANCIESIIKQTYKTFELILVNDGSTDSSLNICEEYLRKDDRIKIINKENGGLSSARNAGIDIAKGTYIGFVDSDDWIDNNMFYIFMDIATNNKADIAQCEYKRVVDTTNEIFINNDCNVKVFSSTEALNNQYNNELGVSTVVAWSKIYKKELFDDLRFPLGKYHEDEFTTYKLLYKANRIVYTSNQLYYYRDTPNSIMNASYNKKRLDILSALDERQSFLENVVKDEELIAKNLRFYYRSIVTCYFRYKECNKEDKETIKDILKSRNIVYKRCIALKSLRVKTKIKLMIFRVSPNCYKYINIIRSKIKG